MQPGDLVRLQKSRAPGERKIGIILRDVPPPPGEPDYPPRVEVLYPELGVSLILEKSRLEVINEAG